jgi:hypothetical protein
MNLTKTQALMVIEHFAAQAAEDAPIVGADKHMWLTRYQASIAIERQIGEWWWDSLVANMSDLQSFDRDPAGFLHEQGWEDSLAQRDNARQHIERQVSWSIDNVYRNSGA